MYYKTFCSILLSYGFACHGRAKILPYAILLWLEILAKGLFGSFDSYLLLRYDASHLVWEVWIDLSVYIYMHIKNQDITIEFRIIDDHFDSISVHSRLLFLWLIWIIQWFWPLKENYITKNNTQMVNFCPWMFRKFIFMLCNNWYMICIFLEWTFYSWRTELFIWYGLMLFHPCLIKLLLKCKFLCDLYTLTDI